jgi:phage-related minor tail protein
MAETVTIRLQGQDAGARALLANLRREIDLLSASGSKAGGALAQSAKGFGLLKASLPTIGALGVFAALSAILRKSISETIEAQNAMAQLSAAVKSTGGAAGLSVKQLDDLSVSIQRTSTFSDEAAKSAESVLLTFDKIKGDQFKEATQAVADLATRMGGDLKGAALQVGKALQDPEQGLTALRRAGVSFNDAQTATIKKLFATGQEAEAQRLILAELRKEFGGSAEAARNTLGGALTGLKNIFGDLFEQTEANTSSTIKFINWITRALEAWNKFANRNVADFSDVTGRGTSPSAVRAPIVYHGSRAD